MVLQIQDSAVPPIAGVEFLALNNLGARFVSRICSEIDELNVWKALLFIDSEVVYELNSFTVGHGAQPLGVILVAATIIHVHVEIPAGPVSGGVPGGLQRLQGNTNFLRLASGNLNGAFVKVIVWTLACFERHAACRRHEFPVGIHVYVVTLKLPFTPVKTVIRVDGSCLPAEAACCIGHRHTRAGGLSVVGFHRYTYSSDGFEKF